MKNLPAPECCFLLLSPKDISGYKVKQHVPYNLPIILRPVFQTPDFIS